MLFLNPAEAGSRTIMVGIDQLSKHGGVPDTTSPMKPLFDLSHYEKFRDFLTGLSRY